MKHLHGSDPLVQLAIWTTAAFTKHIMDGIEMKEAASKIIYPGITVAGDTWQLYIAHRTADGKVHIAGPQPIGDTIAPVNLFIILRSIGVLANWGCGEYQKSWLDGIVWPFLERS